MRRFMALLILVGVGYGAYYFYNNRKDRVTQQYEQLAVYAGDGTSGCMYPIDQVADGKNPVWWQESTPNWEEFPNKKEAMAAGYRDCN